MSGRGGSDHAPAERTQPVPTLGRLGQALGARVHVTAEGPFAVAAVTWRDARGRLSCTLVAKAAYELAPGVCAPVPDPVPIQAEDAHWDNDPRRSVRVPSDLAPFKAAAEVVVIGSAFAPSDRPVAAVTARIIVGSIDKAVTAWVPRRFRLDGSVEETARQTRFPLRWENAAGGPDTDNPCGIQADRADARGRRSIPEVVPAGVDAGRPDEFVPVAGLGPIAPGWPGRRGYLGEADAAWLGGPRESPAPASFPARFFQSAPPDQWLDRPLAANERLVLEGLHDSVPRLVTSLSGIEPWAVLEGRDPVRLQGDLLVIDTDRALATLTFRAQIPFDEAAGRSEAVIVGVPMGMPPPSEAGRRARASMAPVDPIPEPEDWREITSIDDPVTAPPHGPMLPFAGRPPGGLPFPQAGTPFPPPPQPARASYPDGALPFAQPPPPPPPAPARASSPPFAFPTPPPPVRVPAPAPLPLDPPPIVSAPPPVTFAAPPVAPIMPAPVGLGGPLGSLGAPSITTSAVAPPAVVPAAAPPAHAPAAGLKAASDAAARSDEGAEKRRAPGAAPDKPAPPRRLAIVDLIFFDPRLPPRLRAHKRYSALGVTARPRALAADEPRRDAEGRDRADILRALCFGRVESAGDVRRALADSLEDADLDPPLVLVGGELRPTFDEIEALRTTIEVARPVAGSDKRVQAAIAVAQEAVANSIGPRPDAALGLARQIENSTGALSLPPGYVASQVERALLENRKLKRRTLLGASRIRADLALPGESLPVYLPDTIAGSLPLLPSFPVIALCEARPREDAGEEKPEALFALALGRVLHARA